MSQEHKDQWVIDADATGKISHPDCALEVVNFIGDDVGKDVSTILEVAEILMSIARIMIEGAEEEAPPPEPKPKRKKGESEESLRPLGSLDKTPKHLLS